MTGNDKKEPTERVVAIFEDGQRLTHDLFQVNERLRHQVRSLEAENRELRRKLDESLVPELEQEIRDLEGLMQQKEEVLGREIRDLEALLQEREAELEQLHRQTSEIEEKNKAFAVRYRRIERQNSDLINMYVASSRLHSTLDFSEVLDITEEVVVNMIGSEVFGIFLHDRATQRLELVAQQGMAHAGDEPIPVGQGVIGKTAELGRLYTASRAGTPPSFDEPVACFPLKADGEVMGVIAVCELLSQKAGLEDFDFELFTLLSAHAATALFAAKMFTLSERKRATLEGFVDLLKARAKTVEQSSAG